MGTPSSPLFHVTWQYAKSKQSRNSALLRAKTRISPKKKEFIPLLSRDNYPFFVHFLGIFYTPFICSSMKMDDILFFPNGLVIFSNEYALHIIYKKTKQIHIVSCRFLYVVPAGFAVLLHITTRQNRFALSFQRRFISLAEKNGTKKDSILSL